MLTLLSSNLANIRTFHFYNENGAELFTFFFSFPFELPSFLKSMISQKTLAYKLNNEYTFIHNCV